MRKIRWNNFHKKTYNKIGHTRNFENFLNNNLSSYSSFHPNCSKPGNNNFLNLTNINKITNYNTNNSYYKYESPYITNFSNYMSMNENNQNFNNNISNVSINSNKNNQTYNDDINLMTMKLNFRILEKKLSNLNNIIMPTPSLSSYNNILNKRYNNIFNNNSQSEFKKYDSVDNKKYNKIHKKINIKKKFLKNKILKNNDEYIINNTYNGKKIVKNIDTGIKINNFDNEFDSNKLNQKNEKEGHRNILKDLEKNLKNDLKHINKKESDSISDGELSDLADEIFNTIKASKKSLKKIKSENTNNILINKENINNNDQNNNIKAYDKSSNNILKNNSKLDFVIYKNNFTINAIKPTKKINKERNFFNVKKGAKKPASFLLLKKGSKINKNNQEIKIPEICANSNKEKNEKIYIKEDERDIDFNNEIKIPIDNQDDININIKRKYPQNNNKSNIKFKNDILGKNKFYENNSRNKKNILNPIFQEKREYNSFNIENKKNLSKKNISFENDLIYISYNDKDIPTKINLYRVRNKTDAGIKIKFTPKNMQSYLNILSLNKKLQPILLNKDDVNIVRRSFNDNPYNSLDNSRKSNKTENKAVNNKNITKRNIEYIKKVEQKVKNKSLEKNKKIRDFSEEKRNQNSNNNKKKINKKKILSNNRNKKIIYNIKKNNNKNENQSNYIKIDVIQEEEEIHEDSKHEKKYGS